MRALTEQRLRRWAGAATQLLLLFPSSHGLGRKPPKRRSWPAGANVSKRDAMKLVLSVLENPSAGVYCLCWGEGKGWVMLTETGGKHETHRKQPGRCKSLLLSQAPCFPLEHPLAGPDREPAGKAETLSQPQHHRAENSRMGLKLRSNNTIIGTVNWHCPRVRTAGSHCHLVLDSFPLTLQICFSSFSICLVTRAVGLGDMQQASWLSSFLLRAPVRDGRKGGEGGWGIYLSDSLAMGLLCPALELPVLAPSALLVSVPECRAVFIGFPVACSHFCEGCVC